MRHIVIIVGVFLAAGTSAQVLDSLTSRLEGLSQHEPIQNSDSLYAQFSGRLDSLSQKLNHSIDSLSNLDLPPEQFVSKLDSLISGTQAIIDRQIKSRSDSLDAKTNAMIDRYEARLDAKKAKLDSLASKLDVSIAQPDFKVNLNLDVDEFKMPGLGTPEFEKLDIMGLDLPDVPDLPNPGKVTGNLDEFTGEVEELRQRIADLKETDVKAEVERLPDQVEKEVKKVDEISAVDKELNKAGKVTDQVDDMKSKLQNPEEVKEEVKKRSRKAMVDHFAGKEEVINQGIKQLEKYQRKYPSLADIRYPPKKVPNPYSEKPFIERIIPGISFQIGALDTEWKNIDISPIIGYWFTSRFRAGLGGGYRINLNTHSFNFDDRHQVYAFRGLANYRIKNSFFVHAETEAMRTKAGLLRNKISVDPNTRIWDYSLYFGLFKNYRINKSTNGTIHLLYDTMQIGEIFNSSQIAFRFGVEFNMKKKQKEKAK
jgi:hypothetical protein